ncbi:urease accessory protein UreD [Cohnella hashimotonis]|uniref:Urease accessory protein UreD n=1 Tax=Cohnella hashimotonis TaxID=2826895 RepID=A0ABT6TRB7_9BACL|nr:urease accessory protein UreD [Cohnella hashimotonis]MDI4649399.1 urease accessory protein UreD [Cohnella hashimotonis]
MASSIVTADQEKARVAVLAASASLREGATILAGRYCTSPIKIAKTFSQDRALFVMVMDASPGMLAGDRYELQWEAGTDTHLILTNQGFTKVHPCEPGQFASTHTRYRVGTGACVEAMMQPLMLYRDAVYENRTVVDLAPGAVWMQGEVVCPGRTLRGEAFQFESLDNRLSVYYEDEIIYHQRQLVRPRLQRIAAQGGWGDYSHLSTFYVFSDRVTPSLLEVVRETLEEKEIRELGLYAGASLTYRYGLSVVAASDSAWKLQRFIGCVQKVVTRALLGK